MLLVDGAHEGRRWWENVINEDEDRLLGGELDSLSVCKLLWGLIDSPDDIDELSDSEVLLASV